MMEQRSRIIIILLISIVFLSAYTFFFLKLMSLNDEVAAVQSEINEEDEKEASLKIAGKSLSDTVKEREVLDSFFVEREGIVDFIEKIESKAGKNDVSVKIDSLKLEKSEYDLFEYIDLRLVGSGSYENIISFQEELEQLPVATEWIRVSISKIQTGTEEGKWQLISELRVLKSK